MEVLPIEINEEIALSNHPYYVRNICNVSKRMRNECDAWTYQALRKWVYPEKSISDLQNMFPVIYFNDVVYLSLVYNPISESKYFFDWMTLFYHSCRIGQKNPIEYFNNINIHHAADIAYKFNRSDIIESFINSRTLSDPDESYFKLLVNVLRIKSGKEIVYEPEETDTIIEHLITSYPLFSFQEIIEFTIIYKGILYNDPIFFEDIWYYNYLTGFDQDVDEEDDIQLSFVYIANKVGVYKIRDMFAKYGLDVPYGVVYVRPNYTHINALGVINTNIQDIPFRKYVNSITLFDNSDLVRNYIPENKLGIYYVTSGDFAAYINWLREKERDILPLEFPYYGINEFQFQSLDADLVEVTYEKAKAYGNISLKNGVRINNRIVTYS